ncbi:MAG: nucleotidyl transferase AbiEii/AbiGii toxin family protein [Patescibacteria group bacterium]
MTTLCTPKDLRLEVLPSEAQAAFRVLSSLDFFRTHGWYLAGGTALALQVGHRVSFDLDFFTKHREFSISDTERVLGGAGEWETTLASEGTLYGNFLGAKVSFIAYPFFKPSPPAARCGFVKILSPDDIAVMKIIAISQRGKKRDFVDLYWYLKVRRADFFDLMLRVMKQYPQSHNVQHLIKSLTYFADAEEDVMPKLFFDADWKTVRAYFQAEVPKVAKALLRLG